MAAGASFGRPSLTQRGQSPSPAPTARRQMLSYMVREAVLGYQASPHYPVGSDSGFTHYCIYSGSFYAATKRDEQALVIADIRMGSNSLREIMETRLLLKRKPGKEVGV